MKNNDSRYSPQMDVAEQNQAKYPLVFAAVEKLTKSSTPAIIAIDGRCGSGKSSLSAILAEKFDCNVFHMDDFFLPFEMKTKERLDKPGGNVHYERFQEEVLKPLNNSKTVIYRAYSCLSGTFGEAIHIDPKKITIVEGVYCLHPTLSQYYDYKIFLNLSSQIQQKRILKRNGEKMFQNFRDKWIPMEENYFGNLDIEDQCDIVVDTSDFWI
ncbi:uridine kinase family protein [Clostridium sp.]|uniref:uridine kinase family protein n=1 Tax=Clostridium sp. TaxID=1506 RepID=UPI003D6CBA72